MRTLSKLHKLALIQGEVPYPVFPVTLLTKFSGQDLFPTCNGCFSCCLRWKEMVSEERICVFLHLIFIVQSPFEKHFSEHDPWLKYFPAKSKETWSLVEGRGFILFFQLYILNTDFLCLSPPSLPEYSVYNLYANWGKYASLCLRQAHSTSST